MVGRMVPPPGATPTRPVTILRTANERIMRNRNRPRAMRQSLLGGYRRTRRREADAEVGCHRCGDNCRAREWTERQGLTPGGRLPRRTRPPGAANVGMTHREALEVLAARRGERVVVTTHGSVDLWVSLSDTPLDFAYVPASMGQGPALGLGLALALALARPGRGVVVVSGDGHLLMNLGCLVTLASHPAD